MNLLNVVAVLLTLTALFAYVNYRVVRLPTTIGVMFVALVLSLGLIVGGKLGFHGLDEHVGTLLRSIDFHDLLMEGMLSFLLFAGALHVNLDDLAEEKWVIGTLATAGVVLSTFLVGLMTFGVLQLLGHDLPLIYCLVFGALISPTDPIAVLGILKSAGAPRSLEIKITGESLFNDGVGVVVFLALLGIASGAEEASAAHIALLFGQEALGGAAFGLALGWFVYRMLRRVDDYTVEILLTLALVTGGYALASSLHLSGPIATVVAGLFIGNHGRRFAMSSTTCEHLDTFWELLDEILNAVLFVLIGLEVLALSFDLSYLIAGLVAIPVVLLARLITVAAPLRVLRRFREFSPHAVRIMTWGGLRGGISVALALSLPFGPERDVILAITYVVVVFSILVQGLTVGRVVRRAA